MNSLYYGDNLEILRKYVADESVDLIYLDPPFNSKRAYNVLFPGKTGRGPSAQIQAFEDTWHWTEETQCAFDEIMSGNYSNDLKNMMNAFRQFMDISDLMAYLTMMAIRLLELRRVLKTTGSIYLHCDPTASHYLKVLLDQIFGLKHFKNEINWQRFTFHADAKRWGRIHDVILYYGNKSTTVTFNTQRKPYEQAYIDSHFIKDSEGKLYTLSDATGEGQGPEREFFGKNLAPPPGTHWRWSQENINKLCANGRIVLTQTSRPRFKRYLDEMPGHPIGDVWTDIPEINSQAKERLGYPTQKPITLLERIIKASSHEGDLVLDPFCGCGTAIVAAEKLGRRWIGIDITFDAISLIDRRIREQYPDIKYQTEGIPKSKDDAAELFKQNPIQFQKWAVYMIGGQPQSKKGGGDRGIDGLLFFEDGKGQWRRIIIEVKGGNYTPKDVRSLREVMHRDEAPLGVLIALESPTRGMLSDIAAMGKWKMSGVEVEYPVMQIITIQELFSGRKLDLPNIRDTLKKANREIREKEKTIKLL